MGREALAGRLAFREIPESDQAGRRRHRRDSLRVGVGKQGRGTSENKQEALHGRQSIFRRG